MFLENRRKEIKRLLLEKKSVKVVDLVKLFDVSEETIRRDLIYLEEKKIAKKTYGGAILLEEIQNSIDFIPTIQKRKTRFYHEKNTIGKEAAKLITNNKIVILDAGTTTWCVANNLREHNNMIYITNGTNVAEEAIQGENSTVYLLGGKLIKKTMSIVGPQTVDEVKKYNADIVFIATSGISLQKGFTSSNIYETDVKKAMVTAGQKVVVVADHSKFKKQGLKTFAMFEDIDVLITSELVDSAILDEVKRFGVEIITCKIE